MKGWEDQQLKSVEGKGHLSFRSYGLKDLKGLTDVISGCEKDEKTFWFCGLFIF